MASLVLTAALMLPPAPYMLGDVEPPCAPGLIHSMPYCLTPAEFEAMWNPPTTNSVPIAQELVGEPLIRRLVETYFQPRDWDAAMRVARCESNFLATAKNPRSTATGTWQFLKSTWAFVAPAIGAPGWPDGALDPEWSTRGASWLWYKIGPWQWSCW